MLNSLRLEQINYVVSNAEYVRLDKQKLDQWVEKIDANISYTHQWYKYKEFFTEKELILLVFILESMNFCFWKEPIFIYNGAKRSSAMVNIFIDKVLNDKKLLDLDYLINLKYEDLIEIFGIEEGNLKNRYSSLMYTVNKIYNNKNFYQDLFSIKSVDELYKFITDFENFNDVSMYKGKEIYFYKRATLLVNDLFELSDKVRNNIQNIDSVLGCADYVLPRGLRAEGILVYDEELETLIDNNVEVKKDSEYEVEIRAFTLYVIEYVKNKKNQNLNSVRWDNVLWNYFRTKGGNEHKTDTIFY